MRNIRRLFATLGAVAVMGGVFDAPIARALDDKTFPATECLRLTGGGGLPNYFGDGRLFNSTTSSWMDVLCPIVRDNILSPWSNVEVVAIDQHPNAGVVCRIQSANRDSTIVFITAPKSTSLTSGVQGQVLSFPGITEFDRGTFHVRCQIPPVINNAGSGLASYFIAEP